ncbi:MAG: hypothetical protein GF409_07990 [Candidatus Omnitrophica bacterium]|nr:hypothetical protein [Candidatus Omnitrophota bacterium]
MLTVLAYAIKIAISTFLIYFSIKIVEGYNYRNNLATAFLTALILSVIGGGFLFLFGLMIWVFILINWYNIGFFRSFLICFVYGVISFLLQILLVAGLVSGGFVVTRMTDPAVYQEHWEKMKLRITSLVEYLPSPVREKLGWADKPAGGTDLVPEPKKVRIIFNNGRSIEATILMEGQKGYLVDIAEGRSEVVLRKDGIKRIEELEK